MDFYFCDGLTGHHLADLVIDVIILKWIFVSATD
jgi:hypothetical protein